MNDDECLYFNKNINYGDIARLSRYMSSYLFNVFFFIRGYSKKVYHDLDLVEMCGFLHGVQHVLNNIFEGFLDIANF